jgi:hypothetical protein
MTNDLIKIENYYHAGVRAYNKNDISYAAEMFLLCYESYENSDLPLFDENIKQRAEKALELYTEITGLGYNFEG